MRHHAGLLNQLRNRQRLAGHWVEFRRSRLRNCPSDADHHVTDGTLDHVSRGTCVGDALAVDGLHDLEATARGEGRLRGHQS